MRPISPTVEDTGWSFVIAGKLPERPYVIGQVVMEASRYGTGREHGAHPARDHGPEG